MKRVELVERIKRLVARGFDFDPKRSLEDIYDDPIQKRFLEELEIVNGFANKVMLENGIV